MPIPALRSQLRRETGSAYIIALLVLVVLTALGLSLSLITQTEMQVGANERSVQRVFYAADSGIAVATARALVVADYAQQVYTIPDAGMTPGFATVNRVDVSPFYPILRAPCNLCEINDPGIYGEKQYFKINHGVTVDAARTSGSSTNPIAGKSISAMVELQPQEDPVAAHLALQDPAQLARIKF
jgi:PilX N-terminal